MPDSFNRPTSPHLPRWVTQYHSGMTLAVSTESEGQYQVKQVQGTSTLPVPVAGVENDRVEIDWNFGPYRAVGYFIKSTFEIGVENYVLGALAAVTYGNLKDGMGLKYNLNHIRGVTKFYLKNGNEVWSHIDLKVVFDGSFNRDIKLMSF